MKSIVVKEILDFDSTEFQQSLQIYSSSFPPVETKPIERIKSMLRDDENYHLYAAINKNKVLGFSLLYFFKNLGIALLDYMAVAPENQSKGIGSIIFWHNIQELESKIANPVGLILEVQREDGFGSTEAIRRKRRLRFYTKLGARLLEGVNYLIPPQYGSEPEKTYLMILPLKRVNSFTKETVVKYINAIYNGVYGYYENDLIDKISYSLPSRIKICDLQLDNHSN